MNKGVFVRQVVKDYALVAPIPSGNYSFAGNSVGCKEIVSHLWGESSAPRTLLDIGFGIGDLARIVRTRPEHAQWHIDGIDGFHVACCNTELFNKKHYRHIWHGLAQEIPAEQLASYDAICLFDVIEHLDVVASKALLRHLLASLGPNSRLVLSTPLFFWPQDHQNPDDLEEHLIGIPANSLLALAPQMYFIHSRFLVGTFVFSRKSLDLIDGFAPTSDKAFDLDAGRAHLESLGLRADDTLYFVNLA